MRRRLTDYQVLPRRLVLGGELLQGLRSGHFVHGLELDFRTFTIAASSSGNTDMSLVGLANSFGFNEL